MSLLLTYTPAAFDPAQLMDELLRASLTPESVSDDGTTVSLSFPDDTVEADVDAVVAAHVPMERYDPATLLAARDATLRTNRRRADYARLVVQYEEAIGDPDLLLAAAIQSVRVLQARDRDAGLET